MGPGSTQPREVLECNGPGDPAGLDHQPVCSTKQNTSAQRRLIFLGVPKQESFS